MIRFAGRLSGRPAASHSCLRTPPLRSGTPCPDLPARREFRSKSDTMLRAIAIVLLSAALAACVPPELEEALGPDAPGTTYPDLIPQAEVAATSVRDTKAEAAEAEAFEDRVAALKAKANEVKRVEP